MENTQNQISHQEAIEILQCNLGGDTESWNVFLKEQRLHESVGLRPRIPVHGYLGNPKYLESEIYKHIFSESPIRLGFGKALGLGSVDGSSYSCNASVAVDYRHLGQLVVKIETPERYEGGSWISPDAARKLATQLRKAADSCERNAFDVIRWTIVPKRKLLPFPVPVRASTPEFSDRTGDSELDALLAQLG